jgi:lysophospholipase L1-like esterase
MQIIATHGPSAVAFLALAGLALGCGTSHGQPAGTTGGGAGADAGAEVTGGTGGAAGGAGGAAPACVVADPSTLPGRIQAPNPLISLGKPVIAIGPSGTIQNAAQLVDGLRNSVSFGVPTESSPAWVAIDLGTGPSRVLLIWRDVGTAAYTNVLGGAPYDYHVDTSADSTDGTDGTWTTVATVTANPVHVREHALDFSGQRWVKLVATAALPSPDAGASDAGAVYDVRLDEISVFDLSAADGGAPSDTWFFMGDSITQGAFAGNYGAGTRFDDLLHTAMPAYYPAMVAGGITSEYATHAVKHINEDHFLDLNPDLTHVAIGYGTNDSWGNKHPVTVGFEATMETLVTAVLAAGRVPILARIPYACEKPDEATQHTTIPRFNEIIDRLQAKYQLPCGPDLYAYFAAHPEQLADCVHPNSTGYKQMNQLWADAARALYPAN